MIQQYETTFILDAQLSGEQIESGIEKIKKIIEKNSGNVKHIDRWGKRRLAYEIKRAQYGYYVYFRFEAEGIALTEMNREYKLDDTIIRFLTVVVPKAAFKEELKRKDKPTKMEFDDPSEENEKSEDVVKITEESNYKQDHTVEENVTLQKEIDDVKEKKDDK
jgi:small subunit ribosomal protein S6